MDDLLIERVRRRAANPKTRIDIGDLSVPKIASPLSFRDAEHAEIDLGFAVPAVLKAVLCGIGNGGFGPGYGLIGLVGGSKDDEGHDALQLYRICSGEDPEDREWKWPRGLLPLCHWGCAIYSCVDCSSSDSRIVVFDPNMRGDMSWDPCFIRTDRGLESWLAAWSSGTSLWNEIYGGLGDEPSASS